MNTIGIGRQVATGVAAFFLTTPLVLANVPDGSETGLRLRPAGVTAPR